MELIEVNNKFDDTDDKIENIDDSLSENSMPI